MSDTPVYMIVNLKVTDVDTYRNYEKGFFGFLKSMADSSLPSMINPRPSKVTRRVMVG